MRGWEQPLLAVSREGEAINIAQEGGNMHRDYKPQTSSQTSNRKHAVDFLSGFFLGDKSSSNVAYTEPEELFRR